MLVLSFICCAVNEVNLFRKRKTTTAGLKKMMMTPPVGLEPANSGDVSRKLSIFWLVGQKFYAET